MTQNLDVAAALTGQEVNSLQVEDPALPGYVAPDDSQTANFNGVISEMITVWRKLHVEIDSMEKVATSGFQRNVKSGTIHNVFPAGSNTTDVELTVPIEDQDEFVPGQLTIDGATAYTVISNTENTYRGVVRVNGIVPTGSIGKSFELIDDDDQFRTDANLGDALPMNQRHNVITRAIYGLFAPAYVEVKDANALNLNPRQRISFRLKEPSAGAFGVSHFDNAEDIEDKPAFWAFTVVFGYQAQDAKDGDGVIVIDDETYPETPLMGETPKVQISPGGPIFSTYGFCAIFTEGIRDQTFMIIRPGHPQYDPGASYRKYWGLLYGVVAHEIAHAPNGGQPEEDHGEDGLMTQGAGSIYDEDMIFFPETIARFRSAGTWGGNE